MTADAPNYAESMVVANKLQNHAFMLGIITATTADRRVVLSRNG